MAEPQPPAQRQNVLTRKLGPLPTWAWVVIAAGIVIALAWFKTRQGNKKQPDTGGAGQIPEFVNQTYTTIQPPVAEKEDDDDDKHRQHHRGRKRHTRPHPTAHRGGGGGPVPTRGPGAEIAPLPGQRLPVDISPGT